MLGKPTTRSIVIYGFLTVIILLIIITAIGMNRIQALTLGLDRVIKKRDGQVMLMHTMRNAARERSILLQSMMITSDPFLFDDYAMEMSRISVQYALARQQLLQHDLSAEEKALLEKQHARTQKTGAAQNQIITLLNDGERDAAERHLLNIVLPGQRQAMSMMDEFIALKRQQNLTDLTQTGQDINITHGLMISLSIGGVLFSLLITYFVSNRINSEMNRRLASENNLRHSELRERTIRENIIDGILTLDEQGRILSCNRACQLIFGCAPDEMIGQSAHMLLPNTISRRDSFNLSRHLHAWDRKMLGSGHEVIGRRKDNSEFPAEIDVSRMELDGVTTYIVVIRDVTEKKHAALRLEQFNRELEEQVRERTQELEEANLHLRTEIEERIRAQQELTHLASHDSLTELPNRAYFNIQLLKALFRAERHQQIVALLFMDLDGFKEVNDSYGHDAGDQLLIEVSRRLQAAVRREDVVARMGGDEFTVILGELSHLGDAERIAEKIIKQVNQPIACRDRICHVGISIGIAYYPYSGTTADTLLRCADDAMYDAKASGKNRYCLGTTTLHSASQSR